MKPTFKNRPNELITAIDGRKFYNSRSVAVVMVLCCSLNDKLYFAIEKRGTAQGLDKQGLWCLPCGYLDYSESGVEAIKRELWEEVGINLDEFCPWDSDAQPWYVTLRYGAVLMVNALPTLIPNNDAEPNEVADAKWITLEEIPNYEFAFGHDDVIRTYVQKEILGV
jgi:8-oxo-dGTP pyrophosphatase MutT (NUDIX family)